MPTAVVTGAARGLGRAIAERLSGSGYELVLVDLRAEDLEKTAADLGAEAHVLDVSDPQQVEAFAAQVGACDALINNAGMWRFTSLRDTPYDEAVQVLHVNLLAPLLLMQRLVDVMAAGGGGSIVNISSVTAPANAVGAGIYPAAKAAVESLTRIAAVEFGPRGIRCNVVGPGLINTEGTAGHYGDEETRQRRGTLLPLGRYGEPNDIADVVGFLCSDDARYVTGQVIYVDGGYSAGTAAFFRAARDVDAPTT